MPEAGTQLRMPIITLATTEESRHSLTTEEMLTEGGETIIPDIKPFFFFLNSVSLHNGTLNFQPRNIRDQISTNILRFEHGGFGGGGGNSRWVEESRDDGDWSKPTPRNERLEQ